MRGTKRQKFCMCFRELFFSFCMFERVEPENVEVMRGLGAKPQKLRHFVYTED